MKFFNKNLSVALLTLSSTILFNGCSTVKEKDINVNFKALNGTMLHSNFNFDTKNDNFSKKETAEYFRWMADAIENEDYNFQIFVDKILKTSPDNAKANKFKACYELLMLAEKIDNISKSFEKALKLNPNDIDLLNCYASYNMLLCKNQLALEQFNKAIKIAPKNVDSYNNRGVCKINMGHYNEAIKDFNKAIRLDPKYCGAYSGRGKCNIQLSNYQTAIKDFDKVIKLDPKNKKVKKLKKKAEKLLKESQK